MPKYAAEGRFSILFTADDLADADRIRDNLVARMVESIEDGVLVSESGIGSTLRLVSDEKQLTLMDLPENSGDAA